MSLSDVIQDTEQSIATMARRLEREGQPDVAQAMCTWVQALARSRGMLYQLSSAPAASIPAWVAPLRALWQDRMHALLTGGGLTPGVERHTEARALSECIRELDIACGRTP